MDIYIDKANLKSYVSSSANNSFADCNRMLLNKFDLKFTFSKDEIAQDVAILQWITIMNDGFKGTITWNVNHPQRPVKSNSHARYDREQLSSVYLIDDERIQQLKEYGVLLYGGVGSEIDVLSSLIMAGTDYGFVKQLPIKKLSHWKDIRNYTSPCSDIILTDQYLFTFQELYDYNVYELIGEICSHAHESKINIVILTLPQCYDKRTKTSFVPDWSDIRNRIRNVVSSKTGMSPNVTFALSSNLGEHDRTIFTNYKSIESGDTFNYFNSEWEVISGGRHLEIFSLADREFYDNSMKFVSDMQEVINNIQKVNKDNIIGDHKSNYLTF